MSIDSQASELVTSIDTGLPVYVLVDPALGEPLSIECSDWQDIRGVISAREQVWGRTVHQIELDASIELPSHLQPYLVAMQSPLDPWLKETVRLSKEEDDLAKADGLIGNGRAAHRIGGWIQSSANPDALGEALANLMRVNTSVLTKARYQRLADRRVLGWLRHVASSAMEQAAFSVLQSWRYLDALGRLNGMTCRSTNSGDSILRLPPTEWSEFVKGDLIHPTIARWLGELQSLGDIANTADDHCLPRDVRDLYTRTRLAVEQAQQASSRWPSRFTSSNDHTAWAALTLLHRDLGNRHTVAALLGASPESDDSPETIHALSAELNDICQKANP